MTHQEIVERLDAIAQERDQAYVRERVRFIAETKALRVACGAIGHLFALESHDPVQGNQQRRCIFCRANEAGAP